MTALQPRRKRMAEAMAAVLPEAAHVIAPRVDLFLPHVGYTGITDPREAWELMATRGLIGAEDVENPRRRFAGKPPVSELFSPGAPAPEFVETAFIADRQRLVSPHPASVADCVALAADWPGVLAAEANALETFSDRYTRISRFIWRVDDAAAQAARAMAERASTRALGGHGYVIGGILGGDLTIVAPSL